MIHFKLDKITEEPPRGAVVWITALLGEKSYSIQMLYSKKDGWQIRQIYNSPGGANIILMDDFLCENIERELVSWLWEPVSETNKDYSNIEYMADNINILEHI